MASYLSYRNVLLSNSTVIASTLNAGSVSYSTLTGSTMSSRALNVSTLSGSTITISTLSGSTINVSTLTGSTITISTLSGSTINVSTLTGSTIQGTTVFFSTMTASTILTAGSTISLARNVNVPNRFVEVGCDLADSMYLDFHSKDSALPDYSTRIISQGGATTGTGGLNMYASTIGLVATNGVGIGTTVPSAALHIKNATSAMRITGNLTNASTRPAATTTPGAFEIRGSGAYDAADEGFLRLSAGGGSSTSAQLWIDISGYSTLPEMTANIVFAAGAERMRILNTGYVGIGKTAPSSALDITGNLYVNNGAAATTTGQYQGLQISYTGTGATGYGSIMATNPGGTYNPVCINKDGGNVGIGTTNPSVALQVYGAIKCSTICSTSFTFTASALSTVLIANTSSNGYAGNTVIMITVNGLNLSTNTFGGSTVTATAYVAWCGSQPSYANVYGQSTTQGANISISGSGYGVNFNVASSSYYLNYYVTILGIS